MRRTARGLVSVGMVGWVSVFGACGGDEADSETGAGQVAEDNTAVPPVEMPEEIVEDIDSMSDSVVAMQLAPPYTDVVCEPTTATSYHPMGAKTNALRVLRLNKSTYKHELLIDHPTPTAVEFRSLRDARGAEVTVDTDSPLPPNEVWAQLRIDATDCTIGRNLVVLKDHKTPVEFTYDAARKRVFVPLRGNSTYVLAADPGIIN